MKRGATFLLLAVCLVALGTASIVGGVALLRSGAQTLKQSRAGLQSLADRHALSIEQRVDQVSGFVEHLADLAVEDLDVDAIRASAAANRAYRTRLAERFLQAMRAAGLPSAWVHFDPAVLGRTLHVSYFIRNGRLAEEPEYDVRATGHGQDDWFASVVDGDKLTHWTRPYAWPGWGEIVTHSRAVKYRGETIGAAGSELFADEVYRELNKVRLYDTGHLVLLNANLDLLFHPTAQGSQLTTVYQGIDPKALAELNDPGQAQGYTTFSLNDSRWMLAYRRLSNGWLVAAQARESEVLAEHYGLRDQILVLIAAGTGLSLVLAIWLGRLTSRRMDRLAQKLEHSYAELERRNQAIAAQAAELERLANTDVLTGVLSRRAGLAKLGEVVERAARHYELLSIAYIDINDLKLVNDRYGHDEGDRMIREVVDAVALEVGGRQRITRLGGDELLVILEGCNAAAAEALMQAAQRRLSSRPPSTPFPIEFSHGVVEWTREVAAHDVERWIALADQTMYRRKQAMKSAGQVAG